LRERIDVHGAKERYARSLEAVKKDKDLSEYNRKKIIRFVWDLQAEGLTLVRQIKYLYLLPKLAKLLKKDFNKATVTDIKRLVAEVNQSKYADWTKADCRMALKRFYRWLRGLPKGEDPPETKWIKIGGASKRILPEELLTPADIEKLVDVCENSRDRAFTLCVAETGGRIAELLNLRRKHCEFDQYGALLMFSGKTGDRRVRIVASAPALSQWFNDHPMHDDPDAPLWLVISDKHHGEALLYDSARFLLRRLADRAGIKKRVNPQSFRHAAASLLASSLTERQMEQYLGWTPGSKMPKIYFHLSGRETEDAILALHGLKKDDGKKAPKLEVMLCPRCREKNMPTTRFCAKCGLALKIEAAMEVEEARRESDADMNKLMEDPEFKLFLLRKLREMQTRLKTQQEVYPTTSQLPA
jgi:integrase